MYMIIYYIILQNPDLTESRMNLMGKTSELNALLTLELFLTFQELMTLKIPRYPLVRLLDHYSNNIIGTITSDMV